ncbi:MAG TPA: NAD-dependent epimerase/dehydratase family protein [bacterium]|nr:NAD-dependent epimerase/dehydratase family protein [bacterium]HQC50417.1 NAD-dependent epimerase/dehydratase family protein [bacterium]HQG13383.1 NAD-dependent epimerase/dehydratase family protein [bacterium]HQH79986.1 NAD-dependent epimerase/dehydratase family protein [bacterium]
MAASEKILVTGAGGLIGSAVCSRLYSMNIEFRAMLWNDESEENISHLDGIEKIRGDVRDRQSIKKALSGCTGCVHCAALNRLWNEDPREFSEINIDGTRNICDESLSSGIKKIVFTSSCDAMGPSTDGKPRNEDSPINRASVKGGYERSKLESEEIIASLSGERMSHAIIRPAAVIGPGDIHLTPPGKLIRNFLSGKLPAYYNAGINFVDSRDVAAAHVKAITTPGIEGTFILGGHNIFLHKLFTMLKKISGIDSLPVKIPYPLALATAFVLEVKGDVSRSDPGITVNGVKTVKHPWFFDSTKAEKMLDHRPRPIEQTLSDAMEWHKRRMIL